MHISKYSYADPRGIVAYKSSCDMDIGSIVQKGPCIYVNCQNVMHQDVCAKDGCFNFHLGERPSVVMRHANV